MKRVTGIGGIFFKAKDPETLYQWYEKHLGIKREHGFVMLSWKQEDGEEPGYTLLNINPQTTKYYEPSTSSFMLNFRVADMQGLLSALQQEGVKIEKQEDSEYGKFAWVMDPEGNKVELWEPPKA
jgi:catechol 2,3-dioxygenase-like lactoylglutathione lyase family enzyme